MGPHCSLALVSFKDHSNQLSLPHHALNTLHCIHIDYATVDDMACGTFCFPAYYENCFSPQIRQGGPCALSQYHCAHLQPTRQGDKNEMGPCEQQLRELTNFSQGQQEKQFTCRSPTYTAATVRCVSALLGIHSAR